MSVAGAVPSPRVASALGDSHNFGRRVSRRDGRIRKPRTLVWERLLLSGESPLRRLLDRESARDGLGPGAFSFLPTLRFFRSRARYGGEVEELSLAPLSRISRAERLDLARIVGRSLALFSFLGVSDLHWENLALGRERDGRIVFGPLDVELILSDLSLPTETKLLPDADPEVAVLCQHAAGVRRVLPYLGKPLAEHDLVAMAATYRTTLRFLARHGPAIAEVLVRLPELRSAPIRVMLRGTDAYVRARSEAVWPPLLDAERVQLDRGDIPYFFRLYGEPGILHFTDRALTRTSRLPTRGDVPRLEPLLSVARGLRAPSRRRLAEEGLVALLGAFDHPALAGHHEADGLGVTFGARRLIVTASDLELHAKRDLRDLVSSVYLPCRCGEVRAVLVPPVTRCSGLA